MRALDGRALVALAIAEHLRFKDVFAELERRPVDDDAADALVAAYRDGSAPPWLAAALLGETRSARGDLVRERIAIDAAFSLSARQGGRLDGPLATAVASALEAGRVSIAPSVRTMLVERIARGRAG